VKVKILSPLVLLLGLCLSGVAVAAGPPAPAAPGQVFTNESDSGSIELSNIPADESQEPVATAPAAANADNSATPGAEPVAADVPKDPREQYRDKVMQAPEVPTPATTNASRRYKMMDLATYRATVLGNSAPAPQGGASAAK
jgi:hypothetical protein